MREEPTRKRLELLESLVEGIQFPGEAANRKAGCES